MVELTVAGVDMSDVVDNIELDDKDEDDDEYLRCESGGVSKSWEWDDEAEEADELM